MTEPDVALTDYALALECTLFACFLVRRQSTVPASAAGPAAGALRVGFAAFFACLALAAVCGGTLHGFFADEAAPGRAIWWKSSMLAIGAAALAGWAIAASLLAAGRVVPRVLVLGALQFVVYAGLVLFVADDFRLAIVDYLVATAALLAGFVRAARRPGAPVRVGLAVWGLALTVVAAMLQQLRLGLHPRWFNHNAVYHAVQAVALALIFLGMRALLGSEESSRADPT